MDCPRRPLADSPSASLCPAFAVVLGNSHTTIGMILKQRISTKSLSRSRAGNSDKPCTLSTALRLNQSEAHLAILRKGADVWNQWRSQNPHIKPILANVNLSGLQLENINLHQADLSGANLNRCYLYDADFQEANLHQANLSRAGLIGASFHKANLSSANLNRAYLGHSDLSHACFTQANLEDADLHLAILSGATFDRANLARAAMSDCRDLAIAQLQAAKNAHLAYCSHQIKAQLENSEPLPAEDLSKALNGPTEKRSEDCDRTHLATCMAGLSNRIFARRKRSTASARRSQSAIKLIRT